MEQIRLNKYLAQCGVCSRREADRLIEQGRVLVNGTAARTGQMVTAEDEIICNRRQVQGRPQKVVLAYNKPVGVTCTEKDRHAEKTIADVIRYSVRVTYAGRLDRDSEGLLLLSNDGELMQRLMRGANRHEKEYVVKVDREVTTDFLEKMAAGVYLKELDQTTRECEVRQVGKYTFRIILTQGLNRQIRRMCGALGYRVKALQRVRVLHIELGGLRTGEWRELEGQELEELYRAAGLPGASAEADAPAKT